MRELKYCSNMNLAWGFWHIPIQEEDKEKTAFVYAAGTYAFNVMLFELCNASSTFQRMMNESLEGLNIPFVRDYINNIIVKSKTFEEHLQHLRPLFQRLRER